ncbi:MAG: nucleoid-associated protein [Thermoanaerobaculia bacterium]
MEIRIVEVILQRVDSGQDLEPSRRPLPRDQTPPEIFAYFQKHIANSLSSQNLGAASFTSLADPVAKVCGSILSAPEKQIQTVLTEALGILAKKLQPLLPKRRDPAQGTRICDLAVCVYEEEGDGASARRLALLKLDPAEGYRVEPRQDENGLTYYTMVYETEMLPTPKNELQKAAFVRPLAPRPADFDLSILDKESRKADVVASYWIREFLGAEPVLDSRRATKNLLEALVKVENQLLPVDAELWKKLVPAVRSALAGDTVHLTRKWVDELELPAEAAAQAVGELAAKEVWDRAVAVNRPVLSRATQKVSFEGDGGLKVEVREDQREKVVRQVKRVTPKAGKPYYEITLRSSTWERKA